MPYTSKINWTLKSLVAALLVAVVVQGFYLYGMETRVGNAEAGSKSAFTHGDSGWATLSDLREHNKIKPISPNQSSMLSPITGDPFSEMERMRQEMDRMMRSAFSDPGIPVGIGGIPSTGSALSFSTPDVTTGEDETHYIVKMELPGSKLEDLKTTLEENTLTISGTRTSGSASAGSGIQQSFSGSFQRSFTLPGPTVPGSMKADMKDGVLTITVEKAKNESTLTPQ